jgi:hypothetical protein
MMPLVRNRSEGALLRVGVRRAADVLLPQDGAVAIGIERDQVARFGRHEEDLAAAPPAS